MKFVSTLGRMDGIVLPNGLLRLLSWHLYHRLPLGLVLQLASAAVLLFLAPLAEAAVLYHIDFEEPAHHLEAMPSTGAPPDKVTSVIGTTPVYGRDTVIPPPTIVTAPTGLSGQALKLPFGYPHFSPAARGVTLGAPAGLDAHFTLSFEVIPQFSGAGFFDLRLGDPDAHKMSFTYDGYIYQSVGAGQQEVGKTVGRYSDGTVYHVSIELAPDLGVWIGRVNGAELWREPYTATQPPDITFYCYTPFAGQSAVLAAYLDNIVVQDTDTDFNQPPSFTKGPDVAAPEDAPYSQPWATNISPGANEPQQAVSFEVSTDNPALFAAGPAVSPAGRLSFTPASQAFGHANVTVRIFDSGGTTNGGVDVSEPQSFAIDVTPVNDPPAPPGPPYKPIFAHGADVVVNEDSGSYQLTWATHINGSQGGEPGQPLEFLVQNDAPALFSQAPAISPQGVLTFTPAENAFGVAHLSVTLRDNSQPAGSDFSVSATVQFKITIAAVDDPPPPFELVPGNYRALIQAPSPEASVNAETGLITLTVTRSGRFTGKIRMHYGQSRRLTGKISESGLALFGPQGTPQLSLELKRLPPLVLEFNFSVASGSVQLAGRLTNEGAAYAEISGGLEVFTASEPVPPFRNVPADLLGKYTVAFPAPAAWPYRRGSGVGTLTVSRRGHITLAGRLADNTPISYSSPILGDLSWPLYIPTFSGRGSLSGSVRFRDVPGVSDVDGPNLHWSIPGTTDYPAGWPAVPVSLVGSKYSGSGFRDLPPAYSYAHVGLYTYNTFDIQLWISARGYARSINGNEFILKVAEPTGLIEGAFGNGPFRAVILGKQSAAYGYFVDGNGSVSVTLAKTPPAK